MNVLMLAPVTLASRIREQAEIHAACCRWRRQGVACSTCRELNERALRAGGMR